MGSRSSTAREDFLARKVAEAYVEIRVGRDAGLAAPDGHALVSGRWLGRTRRRSRPWPRQFGAAVSSAGAPDRAWSRPSNAACARMSVRG